MSYWINGHYLPNGVEPLTPRMQDRSDACYRLGPVVVAMMIEDGYLTEWPMEFTKAGAHWMRQHQLRTRDGLPVYDDRYHAAGIFITQDGRVRDRP